MISLWLILACASPDETYTTAPGLHADVPARELLAEWMAWRDISRAELERRMTVQASNVRRVGGKPSGTSVRLIDVPSYCPALFYVDEARVVLIHIGDNEALAALTPAELAAWFPPEAELASSLTNVRAEYVNASAGVAWTATSEHVETLELFHPTTVEQYKALFYVEPEPLPDDLGPHAR